MNFIHKKINTKKMFITLIQSFLLLLYTEPDYFKSIEYVHFFFNFFRVLSVSFMIGYYVTYYTFEKSITLILAYLLAGVLITGVVYHQNILSFVSNRVLYILPLSLLTFISAKTHPKEYIKALSFVFSLYIVINVILLIGYPSGIWVDMPRIGQYREGHFLGIGNKMAFTILPLLSILGVTSWKKNAKLTINYSLLLLCSLITVIIVGSSTGLLSVSMYILLIIYTNFNKKSRFSKASYLLLIYSLLFIGIVIMQSTDVFSVIIEDVLGKKATLTGRTEIWKDAILLIKNKPFVGYGVVPDGAYIRMGSNLYSSHNFILQQLLEVGVFGFGIVVWLFRYSIKNTDYTVDSRIYSILNIGLFSMGISFLTEAYSIQYLFFVLVFYRYISLFTSIEIEEGR